MLTAAAQKAGLTQEDRDLLDSGESHLSHTLLRVRHRLETLFGRVPLCAICPAALWYLKERELSESEAAAGKAREQLECFCTKFRGVMYGHEHSVITECDARLDLIENEQV